ncbi:MAG TPA: NTP transferase domain-containing protein, partial [Thermoanaerobaculia bacterium]|nr:NTP transferase domain-containing protein [Thermoanaerobaculia bacterium]
MNCYLLVGGLSTRMGVPKATLTLGGASFERLAIAAASEAFDEVVAVDRAGEPAGREIRTIGEEPHEERAPIFGLARALRDAGASRLWLLAVDYPLLTAPLLRDLRDRFERSGAEILVPWWDGVPQMLCAGYSPSLAPRVDAAIAAGGLALRALLEGARVEHVPEAALRERH